MASLKEIARECTKNLKNKSVFVVIKKYEKSWARMFYTTDTNAHVVGIGIQTPSPDHEQEIKECSFIAAYDDLVLRANAVALDYETIYKAEGKVTIAACEKAIREAYENKGEHTAQDFKYFRNLTDEEKAILKKHGIAFEDEQEEETTLDVETDKKTIAGASMETTTENAPEETTDDGKPERRKNRASLKQLARLYEGEFTDPAAPYPIVVWKVQNYWNMLYLWVDDTLTAFASKVDYERAREIVSVDKNAVVLGKGSTFGLFDKDDTVDEIVVKVSNYYKNHPPELLLRNWTIAHEKGIQWDVNCEIADLPIYYTDEPKKVNDVSCDIEIAPKETTEKTAKDFLEEAEKQTDSESDAVCAIDETVERYREIRKISARSLDQLCEQNEWHTLGGDCDYERLLYALTENKENLSATDIIRIAEDIVCYSRLELSLAVERVASEVARIADVFFEKVCAEPLNRAPP